jgi:hypothetical protein
MRTSLALLVVGLAACGGAAEAPLAPQLDAGGIPPHVASASGAGHFLNPANSVLVRDEFTARSNADGTVDGEYQRVAGAAIIHGTITCVTVVGNVARVGGTIDRAAFTPVGIGSEFLFQVTDVGEGGEDDLWSRVAFNQPAGTAAEFCETGAAPTSLDPVEREGNVQVRG